MKKILTIDGCFVAFASAIGYGLGYAIPEKLGCGVLLSILICMTLGSVPGIIAGKVVFSKAVQEKTSRRILSFAGILAVFALAYLIGLWFEYDLFEELFVELGYEIVFPILGFAVSLLVRWLRVKKIRAKYGDGSEGFQISEKGKAFMLGLEGENHEITGDYNPACAVKTENGIFVGEEKKKLKSWLGIPYAKAPVGDLRWKAPQAPDSSEKVFEAWKFGSSPFQAITERNALRFHAQGEDCLTLNIWAANQKKEPEGGREVLFYIHGGDFTYGGSADPLWNGAAFAEKHPEVVFVSFNYRLGLMGFVDFSAVPGGEEYPDAANLGMLDQIAALKWVYHNIAAFGGNPEKITVMGDGAGASSIVLLSLCKEANTLFRRAVMICGSSENVGKDPELPRHLGELLKEEFSAGSMADLRKIPEADLMEFNRKHYESLANPLADGKLFPENLYDAAIRGGAGKIEFMIAISDNEYDSYRAVVGDEIAEALVNEYLRRTLQLLKEEDADTVRAILAEKEKEIGKQNAANWLANCLYNTVGMLCFASCLRKAGNPVRCFYWNAGPLIEKLGSGTLHITSTLLSNADAAEALGAVIHPDIELILQTLLMKFLQGSEPELSGNELKGVHRISWEAYPAMLSVSEKDIVCTGEYQGKDAAAINELVRIFSL